MLRSTVYLYLRLTCVHPLRETFDLITASIVVQVQDPHWRQLLELCVREGSYRGCPCLDLGLTVR